MINVLGGKGEKTKINNNSKATKRTEESQKQIVT